MRLRDNSKKLSSQPLENLQEEGISSQPLENLKEEGIWCPFSIFLSFSISEILESLDGLENLQSAI